MLDYRAHKLYQILFFIPNTIIWFVTLIGVPIIAYNIGFRLVDSWLLQIGSAVIAIFFIELIWQIFTIFVYGKFALFFFKLFVDIIPHDGRSEKESIMVVGNGHKAITLTEGDKHPNEWKEDLIDRMVKLDWVNYFWFRDSLRQRLEFIKKHFHSNDELNYNEHTIRVALEENFLQESFLEKNLGNKLIRGMIYRYSFFVFLILSNPISW